MKIIATADLHYEFHRKTPKALAEIIWEITHSRADVLVLAGDTGIIEDGYFTLCLSLLKDFAGTKLVVAGNHDLWTGNGDSSKIYHEDLPQICKDFGFHCLDLSPLIVGTTGFVGNIGWYDYSFREETLGIPLTAYQAKTYEDEAWNDRKFIRWVYSDQEFTQLMVTRLERDIQTIYPRVDKIVVVTHQLPFLNLNKWPPGFYQAFTGSRKMGEMLLKYPKAKLLVCGHTHLPARVFNGGIECINVGSTYEKKKLKIINVSGAGDSAKKGFWNFFRWGR